jgi:hypothetical protein
VILNDVPEDGRESGNVQERLNIVFIIHKCVPRWLYYFIMLEHTVKVYLRMEIFVRYLVTLGAVLI